MSVMNDYEVHVWVHVHVPLVKAKSDVEAENLVVNQLADVNAPEGAEVDITSESIWWLDADDPRWEEIEAKEKARNERWKNIMQGNNLKGSQDGKRDN